MADKTWTDLITDALSDDFDATKYTARATWAINDGLREIARRVDLPVLDTQTTVALVAGTSSYTLPTDLIRIKALTDADHRPLTELSSIALLDALPTATGTPNSFLPYGPNLLVYPTPTTAASLTLRYRKNALAVVTLSDPVSATVPDEYAFAMVCFARARMFRFEDDPQMADYWQGQFEHEVGLLKGDVQNRTRSVKRVGEERLGRRPSFARP